MKFLSSKTLYITASFLAGFSVMTVELISARIVAPLVGSSVFTWTSVIGTTLLGLSIGSWVGGKLTDKYHGNRPVSILFLASSVLVVLILPMAYSSSYLLSFSNSIILLNLALSVYLFLIPAIAMGSIQPFILKRYATDFSKIGSEYGILSAVWSLGSILGVFLTGFFFVSTIGSGGTIYSIAVVLFLVGFIFSLKDKRMMYIFAFVAVIAGMSLVLNGNQAKDKTLVYEAESDYYKIRVKDAYLSGLGNSRILFLDFDSHSIYPELVNENFYPEMYPVFSNIKKNIKDILVIGAGAYTMPQYFSSFYSSSTIDVIEPDPELLKVGNEYFNLSKYNINTIVGDARTALPLSEKKYDLIFGDAYSSFISVPWHLLTLEWNDDVAEKLNDGGIYALNFIGVIEGSYSGMFQSVMNTFAQTFPNFYIFRFGENNGSISNIVLVGVKGELPVSEAELVKAISKGKNSFMAKKIVPVKTVNVEKESIILTDDFAPVERLMQPIMRRYFRDDFAFVNSLFK